MHHRVEQKAYGINQDVTLLAFDFLTGIVSTGIDTGPPFSTFFTLWLSITQAVGLASRPICSRDSI
jgi:hypothetical protein